MNCFPGSNRKFLLVPLYVLVAVCAFAEPGVSAETPRKLTLAQALELAIQHNPTMESSRADVEASEAQSDIALAAFLPRIDAIGTYTNTNKPSQAFGIQLDQGRFTQADFDVTNLNNPGLTENFRSALSLTQPIYNGGRENLGMRMAEVGQTISIEGLEDTRQRMLFHVTKTYHDLALAKSTFTIAAETLTIAVSNAKQIARRYREGVVVKSDLLQAQVRLAGHQEESIRARQRVGVATLALRHRIGVDYPVDSTEPLAASDMSEVNLEGLISDALESRPDYRQLSSEWHQTSLSTKVAESAYFPNLNLQANYELNNTAPFSSNGSNNYSVLGMFNLNLFKGLGDSAQVRKAKAQESKTRHLLEAKRRSIEVEVVDSASQLTSAHERLKVTARAVEQAEENLRIVRNRYQAGLAPVLDLFTAELVLAQAKRHRLNALYDFQISQSRLHLMTGQLGKKDFG